MLCQHEEIAVQIAHGYAKATGRPMAGDPARPRRAPARLHGDLLRLHRPGADLHHRCDRSNGRGQAPPAYRLDAFLPLVQGNAVRDYVKWDYQPTSIDGVPESFARAYSIHDQPSRRDPIYMCYDDALSGGAADLGKCRLPPAEAAATPAPIAP